MTNQETMLNAAAEEGVEYGGAVEAYGQKGNTQWRRTFKNRTVMLAWADANDAEILGTREAK